MCTTPASLSIAESAHSRGNLATGMFIGGGLLAGAAVVLWMLSPSTSDTTSTTTSWRVAPSIHQQQIGFTVGHAL